MRWCALLLASLELTPPPVIVYGLQTMLVDACSKQSKVDI